ncbi:hypothetical protein F2P56_008078, partial [Juglans regia]
CAFVSLFSPQNKGRFAKFLSFQSSLLSVPLLRRPSSNFQRSSTFQKIFPVTKHVLQIVLPKVNNTTIFSLCILSLLSSFLGFTGSRSSRRSALKPRDPQEQRRRESEQLEMESSNNNDSSNSSNNRLPLSEVVSECVKRWFKDTLKDAKAGDINMQILVGQMYYSGYGVPRDAQKGRVWITRASRTRSSVWKVSDKRPGYNASDSDSDELKADS